MGTFLVAGNRKTTSSSVLVLGEQEDDEQLRQDCGDSCSEEDFSMDVSHHGSERLGDGEGESHVG